MHQDKKNATLLAAAALAFGCLGGTNMQLTRKANKCAKAAFLGLFQLNVTWGLASHISLGQGMFHIDMYSGSKVQAEGSLLSESTAMSLISVGDDVSAEVSSTFVVKLHASEEVHQMRDRRLGGAVMTMPLLATVVEIMAMTNPKTAGEMARRCGCLKKCTTVRAATPIDRTL